MFGLLRLPETHGLDLDDPQTTLLHRRILRSKPALESLYRDWYETFEELSPKLGGNRLEIGSGGGFLKEVIPQTITSDILELPHLDRVFSAEALPFEDESLTAIYLLNTLHHLPEPLLFLGEAQRCLRVGGRMICIEPANTPLSRLIYTWLHHEPFLPQAGLSLVPGKPLSHSNQALPWILFVREAARLRRSFPRLRLVRRQHHTPLRYLLSGGLRYRCFLPGPAWPWLKRLEGWLKPLNDLLGLFMTVVVEKLPSTETDCKDLSPPSEKATPNGGSSRSSVHRKGGGDSGSGDR